MNLTLVKKIIICVICLLFLSDLNSQSLDSWIDTLKLVYPNQVEIKKNYSKPSIEIELNSLGIDQIEDIAQYIRSNGKKYYFKHYYYWHDEKIYDARRSGELTIEKIPEQIYKDEEGIRLSLEHTKYNICFIYKFSDIRKIEYLGLNEHNYTISNASSTTYEKQSFNVTCAQINKSKVNRLLHYLDVHYQTGIPSFGTIQGLYDKNHLLSNSLNADSTITFKYSIITRDLKKEDLRTTDFSKIIAIAIPLVAVAGLKKLYDYTFSASNYYYSSNSTSNNTEYKVVDTEVSYELEEWEETPIFGTSGTADPERIKIKFKCPSPNSLPKTAFIGRNLNFKDNVYATGTNVCGFGHKRVATLEEAINATIDCICNDK